MGETIHKLYIYTTDTLLMLHTHPLIFSLHDKRRERIVGECETGEEMERIEMCEKQKELSESEKRFVEMVEGWKVETPDGFTARTLICEKCSKLIDPTKVSVYTYDYKYVFCSAGCRFEWEREHGVGNKGQIEIVEKSVGGN